MKLSAKPNRLYESKNLSSQLIKRQKRSDSRQMVIIFTFLKEVNAF